ncbi:hypothetical protein [Bernardetia sp.]|uniref:hypothetical protein n=1 Tax=Bernardetia sp. TaxID=1937974 RepID=UPI0025C4DFFA|nr:hypothetical protein [Bernardetia sp.]
MVDNEEDLKNQIQLFVQPEKGSSLTENILWELLIKNGIKLTENVVKIELQEGVNVYHTSDKRYAFILDAYSKEAQDTVLKLKPKTVICLDSLFKGEDKKKTNAQLKFEDNGITFKTV